MEAALQMCRIEPFSSNHRAPPRRLVATRLHMRRLTRLTLAFSKKLENFQAAVALHFAYYNSRISSRQLYG